jgi:hypothetical protein
MRTGSADEVEEEEKEEKDKKEGKEIYTSRNGYAQKG